MGVEVDAGLGGLGAHHVEAIASHGQGIDVNLAHAQRAGFDARDVEHIVDHVQQMPAG